jgi:hypothetical protein
MRPNPQSRYSVVFRNTIPSARTLAARTAVALGAILLSGCPESSPTEDASTDIVTTSQVAISTLSQPMISCSGVQVDFVVTLNSSALALPATSLSYSLAQQMVTADAISNTEEVRDNECPDAQTNPGTHRVCLSGLESNASYFLIISAAVDGGTVRTSVFIRTVCPDAGMVAPDVTDVGVDMGMPDIVVVDVQPDVEMDAGIEDLDASMPDILEPDDVSDGGVIPEDATEPMDSSVDEDVIDQDTDTDTDSGDDDSSP